jgi:hypothetical protein
MAAFCPNVNNRVLFIGISNALTNNTISNPGTIPGTWFNYKAWGQVQGYSCDGFFDQWPVAL